MQTEHLVNYNYATVHDFFSNGMITPAQWEAYDFIFCNTVSTSGIFWWGSLLEDSRLEFWKMYHVLPVKVQKVLHNIITK